MVAVTTPYASGTITAVAGTTITISGGASSAWVGRCIRLTSGGGAGQIRKIVAAPSATSITVDYAWNAAPATLAAEGLTDVAPASGDGFVISYFLDDIDDGTTLIKDANAPNEYRFVNSNHTFSSTAFLYDTNKIVRVPTVNIILGIQACWRLGDIDNTGRTSGGCSFIEASTGGGILTGWGDVGGNCGDVHLYGCLVSSDTSASVFWRIYRGETHIVRFVDCVFNIPAVGMRLRGTRSAVLNCRWYGNTSAIGPFGPIGNFGVVKGVDVAQGLNAVYHSWSAGLSGQFVQGVSFSGVTNFATIAGGGGTVSALYVFEVADVSVNALAALPRFYVGGTVAGTQPLLRVSNYLAVAAVDQAGDAITDTVRMVVRDNVPTVFANLTSTSGAFARQKLLYREMPYLNGNVTWAAAGGTTFAPYAVALASYLYQPFIGPLPMLTSTTVNATMLEDAWVTETDKATVDAYITLGTLDRVYDRAKAWFVDNLAGAVPSFGVQPVTASGTEIDFGSLNVVVDATAGAALAISGGTLTIAATTLAAGTKFTSFRTTGNVSTANGAGITALYTDSAGSSARLDLNGLTSANVYVQDGAGTQRDYQTGVSGTYSLIVPPGATGTWRWVAKRAGYEHATGTFLPGSGGVTAVAPSLPQKLLPDGSPMYQGTTSSLCAVSFSGTTNAYIDIGNGIAPRQAVFDESEDALVTAAGLRWIASGKDDLSQFDSAAGDFLFMTAGWRLRRASAGDVNATVQAFVQSTEGTPVDEVNGPVRFLASDSPTAIAQAVIAAMNATPPNVNVEQMNGYTVTGTGQDGDPWRATGVLP